MNLSATSLKVNNDFAAHVRAAAPMVGKGKIFGWFKEQIAQAINAAGATLDKDSFLVTIKTLFDTVVKPNDGIPDFIDEILWHVVVEPLVEKLVAKHTQPAAA